MIPKVRSAQLLRGARICYWGLKKRLPQPAAGRNLPCPCIPCLTTIIGQENGAADCSYAARGRISRSNGVESKRLPPFVRRLRNSIAEALLKAAESLRESERKVWQKKCALAIGTRPTRLSNRSSEQHWQWNSRQLPISHTSESDEDHPPVVLPSPKNDGSRLTATTVAFACVDSSHTQKKRSKPDSG